MATSHEAAAFMREIIADPDNDVPRLVYADWFADLDDPRGELIRVQCELAAGGLDDAEATRLAKRE